MAGKMDERDARRAVLLKLLSGGALGVGGVFGLIRPVLGAESKQGVRYLKGAVTIDGKPASMGQIVQSDQTVSTGAGGEVVLVVGDDAFLQRENSSMRLEGGAVVTTLRFLNGKVLSVFGKRNKQLITPTATIGIRGTACYIEVVAEKTYFCLCYGEAEISPNASPARIEIWSTTHHERPVYIGNQAGQLLEPAPMINHSDAELIMLESMVDRLPPFYGKGYAAY